MADPHWLQVVRTWTKRTLKFVWRVLKRFSTNKGLLLAGAVGYNALLSVVPLLAVILFVVSLFIDESAVFGVIATELTMVLPGQSDTLVEVLQDFLAGREVFGGIAIGVLIFLSTLAFRMLEDAMHVIFRHHEVREPRHPLISWGIAFSYIMIITLALMALTVVSTTYETLASVDIEFFDARFTVAGYSTVLLKAGGFLGMVALFSSFYRVLPVARVRYRLAIVGGVVAAVLWEITRTVLVYYFASLSLINVVYGSLATVIIVLLSLEIASVILLLGAQVIAELEVTSEAGLEWWEEPTLVPAPILSAPEDEE